MAARIRVNGCAHTALTAGELQRDEHPVCLSENEGLYASFFLDNKRHMVGRFFITCSGRLLDSCCYDQKQRNYVQQRFYQFGVDRSCGHSLCERPLLALHLLPLPACGTALCSRCLLVTSTIFTTVCEVGEMKYSVSPGLVGASCFGVILSRPSLTRVAKLCLCQKPNFLTL